jgi:acyl carrier protein phosphodiesterase
MNYLAHCFLSCSDEDLLLGNIITDFMRKKEEQNYSGRVLEGIHLHRKIDEYTDSHNASLSLRTLLRKRHGKYASVVVDLVWDHMLCQHWSDYSGSTLDNFAAPIYEILLRRKSELPTAFQTKVDSMIGNDFLLSYRDKLSMQSSLEWMDRRVNFPSDFVGAIYDVEENYKYIEELFSQFFPDLITYVDSYCSC